MLAKAHIAVGMAAAFSIRRPETAAEALPVITGGALGCLICDLDCENRSEKSESSRWRLIMAVTAAVALIEDHLLGAGMWKSLGHGSSYLWFAGMAAFVIICIFADGSGHRGFSHSLLAMALETLCIWLIFPSAAVPFAIAFASHVLLDMMNKRSVRLFYPAKKGICLGWFYADRLANKAFAAAGTLWLIAAVIICLR